MSTLSILHSLLIEHLGDIRGHDNQRSTSVDSSTGVLEIELLLAETDLLKLDLPVSLPPDGDILELTAVGGIVDTTKDGLTSVGLARPETEGEDRLVKQVLSEHVVEWRDDVVDRDSIVGETQDTVKLAKGESESGLLGRLGKVLVLDRKITDGDGVLRDEALERSRAVSDGKVGSVGFVGGRLGRVVFGVKLYLSCSPNIESPREVQLTKQAIEVHLTDGTQRLDDPVSRTTLNS